VDFWSHRHDKVSSSVSISESTPSENDSHSLYWLGLYELSSTRVLPTLFHIDYSSSVSNGILSLYPPLSFLNRLFRSHAHWIVFHHTPRWSYPERRFDIRIVLDNKGMVLLIGVHRPLHCGNLSCHENFNAFSFPFIRSLGTSLRFAYHHEFRQKLFSRAGLRPKLGQADRVCNYPAFYPP